MYTNLSNGSITSQAPGSFLDSQSRWTIGNAHNGTPNQQWMLYNNIICKLNDIKNVRN